MRLDVHSKEISAGVDEVGRGSLVGPVYACACVILKPCSMIDFQDSVRDSKELSSQKRSVLVDAFEKSEALTFTIGIASVEEIDRFNIHHATLLAMTRALESLSTPINSALIDGKYIPPSLPYPAYPLIKGDKKNFSIACASIIAKVLRDKFMDILHNLHPQYGWSKNKGYGTSQHTQAIKQYGATSFHRRSFAPVKFLKVI